MAFDSTISGPAANSYIPVTTADTYFTFHLDGPTFWNGVPTATKQAALVQASNRIDMETYQGRPTVDAQRLQWPRSFVTARNYSPTTVEFMGEFYLPSDAMPKSLEEAVCEMALYYLKAQSGEFTVDENDLETLSAYKIGPIDVSIKGNIKADRLPSKVKVLLQSIGPDAWLGNQPLTYTR